MNYIYGVFLIVVISLVCTVVSKIPYLFINRGKVGELNAEKRKLKKGKSDEALKKLIKVNLRINKIIILPLLIQFAVIFAVLGLLKKINLIKWWFAWFLLFEIIFNRLISKKFASIGSLFCFY